MFKKIYNSFFHSSHPASIRQKYNIPNTIKLKINITEKGYLVATSPDLPGLITQARDAKELLNMVNDAVLTYFDVPDREANIVFDQLNIDGQGCISYKNCLQNQTA